VKASVESRYACSNPEHKGHGSANLEPLNNGTYVCEACGWTNAPKAAGKEKK